MPALLLSVLLCGTPTPTPPTAGCPQPRVVVKGDTLAGLATECYGGRAWAGLLGQALERMGSRLSVGATLTLPAPRDLAACSPTELCAPLVTAWEALRAVQGQTQHVKAVPPSAKAGLDAAVVALGQALDAARRAHRRDLLGQLRGALEELTDLEQGHNPEPGYHEETCHQHLAFALERLGSRLRVVRMGPQGPAPAVDGHCHAGDRLQVVVTPNGRSHYALVLLEKDTSAVLVAGDEGRAGRVEIAHALVLRTSSGTERVLADGARVVALFANHPIGAALAVSSALHDEARPPDLQVEALTLRFDL